MAVYVRDVTHQLLLKSFSLVASCVGFEAKMLQDEKERIKVLPCWSAEVLEASMNTL